MPPTTTTKRRLLRSSSSSRNRTSGDDDDDGGNDGEVSVAASTGDVAVAAAAVEKDKMEVVHDGKKKKVDADVDVDGGTRATTRRRSSRRRTPRTLTAPSLYDPSSLKPSSSARETETGLERGADVARSARHISGGKSKGAPQAFGGKIAGKDDEGEDEESLEVSLGRLRSIISDHLEVQRARARAATKAIVDDDAKPQPQAQAEGEQVFTAFPPTLFTDASYRRGVTLPVVPRRSDEQDAYWEDLPRRYFLPADEVFVGGGVKNNFRGMMNEDCYRYGPPPPPPPPPPPQDESSGKRGNKDRGNSSRGGGRGGLLRSLPILTEREGMSWCHRHAASSAAARRFPFEAVRLLGTVTLNLEEEVYVEIIPNADAELDHSSSDRGGPGDGGGVVGSSSSPWKRRGGRRGKRDKVGVGMPIIPPPPPRISLADVAVGPWRMYEGDDDDDDRAAVMRERKKRRILLPPLAELGDIEDWVEMLERMRSGRPTPPPPQPPLAGKVSAVGSGRSSSYSSSSSSWRRRPDRHSAPRSVRNITARAAHMEASAELLGRRHHDHHVPSVDDDDDEVEAVVERRAESIRRFWTAEGNRGPSMECWDTLDGGFADEALGEEEDGGGRPVAAAGRGRGCGRRRSRRPRHVHIDVLAGWLRDGGRRVGRKETITVEVSSHDPKTTTGTTGTRTGTGAGRSRGSKRKRVTTSAAKTTTATATTTLPVSRRVRDLDSDRTVSLYGGIRQVPTDAKSVLDALLDLGSSRGLYHVPLLVPHAVMHPVGDDESSDFDEGDGESGGRRGGGGRRGRGRGRRRRVLHWKVRIGVYVHRLLPEVLTCHHLHVVMSALDVNSYRVTKPTQLPPTRGVDQPPVFASAPTPRVDMTYVRSTLSASRGGGGGGGYYDDGDRGDGDGGGDRRTPLRRGCGDGDYNEVVAAAGGHDGEEDVIVIDDDDDEEMSSSSSSSSSSPSSMRSSSAPASTSASSLPTPVPSSSPNNPPPSFPRRRAALDNGGGNRNDAVLEASTREEGSVSPFSVRGLLKLLESTGNDISNWPSIEKVLAPKLRLSLMIHQIHAICWMNQMEDVGSDAFGINSILWEEREFYDGGRYYYSPALGQIRLGRPPKMKGGLLCDEMGLGKTIEILGLIISTLDELRERAEVDNNSNSASNDWHLSTHATLIVVPPALVMQWTKEVEKVAGTSLKVSILHANTGLIDAPFLLEEEELDDEEDEVESIIARSDVIITTYESLVSRKTAKPLASIKWGRIVLDEMQEIRSSTTQISKNCERLNCDRRWMLSGTPLFDGIDDLRGELNFLRLEPYGAKLEDGFFDFSITNHWEAKTVHGLETLRILGTLMLRRSKDMTLYGSGGMPILGLKPLTVEYVPVMQTESERALYCWMEYLVSRELNGDTDDYDCGRSRKARAVCIRLLRELCVTPVLLNGGLGVPSQLDVVNRLMVNLNRREEIEDLLSRRRSTSSSSLSSPSASASRGTEDTRVFSCDRALRFLTQANFDMRTEDDFESDLVFGGGGGVTNRNLAHDSAEMKYNEAETEVREATEELATAKKKRARLRWHLALERLTTGCFDRTVMAGQRFRGLWRLRSAFIGLLEREQCSTAMPSILTRGWRPSPTFLRRDLYASRPDFAWAHPIALMIDNVPTQLTEEELRSSLHLAALRTPRAERVHGTLVARLGRELSESSNVEESSSGPSSEKARIDDMRNEIERAREAILQARDHDEGMKKPAVVKMKTSSQGGGGSTTHWRAIVHFNDEEDARNVALKASKMNGLPLQSEEDVPHIEARIEAARDRLCQIESINKVHPSRTNQQKETEARKSLAQAKLGLRIVLKDKDGVGHVILSRPNGPFRSSSPRTASALVESTNRSLGRLNEKIANAEIIVERGKRVMERLLPALNRDVPEELVQTTAFGILEALSSGELEKTQCSICLCPLGSGQTLRGNQASISMIKCGHFFCVGCLNHHVQQRTSSHQTVNCPNCRRPFCNRDVVHIDHRLKNEQELLEAERIAAKAMVEEASKMLERSNGQLSPNMWRSLFLAFGFPEGVSQRAHPVFTAVPREVLAHLRAATGMDIHNSRNDAPDAAGNVCAGRSSKVQALLADLPRSERSVVFTTTKDTVKHLMTVMRKEGIGCRALFTGQLSAESEQAVTSWEADIGETEESGELPCPVLLIQAGAATSGLTLTAASKIFLMEPFLRQEEEQQAFARCHRYGQKNEVHVKCYFTPVSVESRLLEWRKLAQSSTPGIDEVGTKVVVRDVVDETEDLSEDTEVETESEIDTSDDAAGRDGNEDVKQSMFLLGLME